MTTHPVPIMALYGGDSDRNPRLVVNAVQPGDTYVVLSFDDLTGNRMALALTIDAADALRKAVGLAMTEVSVGLAHARRPAKPKRLRCRASVLPRGGYRSRQCERAATGTHDMWVMGNRTTLPACTIHQRNIEHAYWKDGNSQWESRPQEWPQEYMA